MNIKIIQKRLIIANIALFVLSFLFLEYSKMFRMSQEKHWIYSWGHNWWFMVGIPSAFFGSVVLGIFSLWRIKQHKILYFIFSLIPLILFIILIYI